MQSENPFAGEKALLLEELKRSGIKDKRVLSALEATPREWFMASGMQKNAYYNAAFPIGQGQTISQPYIVAFMTEALRLTPECHVLEIGTGSGYQTAILLQLAKQVYTVERHKPLLTEAEERLAKLGIQNVTAKCGDGSKGWKEYAPFDRIIVTAAARHIPPLLTEQLKAGGVMVIPVEGDRYGQELLKVTKTAKGIVTERLLGVVFVPLVEE